MTELGKGRGRGLALLQALQVQKKDAPQPHKETEESATEHPSLPSNVPPTVVGASVQTVGGRGKMAAMLLAKMQQKREPPALSPAADGSPLTTLGRGAGRGLQLLRSLKLQQPQTVSKDQRPDESASEVTKMMARSTISTQASVAGKCKDFSEIKTTEPVVRKGESGQPRDVTCNFVYLHFEENNVFEYDVAYTPEQDYKSLRFKLLNEHNHYFKQKSFDGTTLYVPHQLPEEAHSLVSTNPYDESKVQISITYRRTRRLSEMVHIYNVLFKQIMKDLQMVRFGREHFNEHAAMQIPQHKLEVWPGYVTAVDEYEGGLMLTLDSTHRVLRTESVLSFIKEAVQRQGAGWKKAVCEKLIGSSVMTTYNKKLFRVDSIDDSITPRSTFEKNEKGVAVKISYMEYYKKNYGIDIMDLDQPMLISRQSKYLSGSETKTDFMICLVPELCQLTGLTEDQRSNFHLMKDVATYTRVTPNQRHYAFKKFIENVNNNETARNRLKGWGLSIAPETVNIAARTLAPEAITFGNNVKINGSPNADWNSDVTRNPVLGVVDVMRWVILYTDRDKQVTMNFVDTLKRCCGPMGIHVSKPDMVRLANDRTDSYVMALKKCIVADLQLVVCICPTSRDDRYSAIKKICCADNPVPSQVINARTVSNNQRIRSITQKILLQINCKLGGTLWSIHVPLKGAMVVGMDTYHDAARTKQSVLAFVSSYSQNLTQWFSMAVFQQRGMEIADGLNRCLLAGLKHYLCVNGNLPEKIIIYRDGVGDGQLKVLKNYELPQMRASLYVLGEYYQPKLTYVVVQKRINTRIFLKQNLLDFQNPPPGTVVDHMVTRRDWYDFLLVSQKVNQGTVTPTHYIVVHDDSEFTPDRCQKLTYKLCYLYYNWPGTIRVPAPCQYAHKLAYLVGQHVHQAPSTKISDKLFFL